MLVAFLAYQLFRSILLQGMVSRADLPTTSQSGHTIRHLRFRFNDSASHMGTLHADGG
jgi:hypothetical protein